MGENENKDTEKIETRKRNQGNKRQKPRKQETKTAHLPLEHAQWVGHGFHPPVRSLNIPCGSTLSATALAKALFSDLSLAK